MMTGRLPRKENRTGEVAVMMTLLFTHLDGEEQAQGS
jgi:hypothetical protein